MRGKLIDLVLVVLILASVGFIGVRIFQKPAKPKSAPELGIATPNIGVPVTGTPAVSIAGIYGVGTQAVFAHQPKLTTEAWTAALAKERLVSVAESAKCRDGVTAPDEIYQILSLELRDLLVANGGGVVVRYGRRKCQRKGQTLTLQYYGHFPDEAYISNMGTYTVLDIVELDRDRVSNGFWSLLKTSREANRSPYTEMMLLRIEKKGDAKPETDLAPTTHFRYTHLAESDLETAAVFKKSVSPVILDLRKSALRTATPIPGAVAIEFKTEGGPLRSDTFRWDVKNSDIAAAEILMQPIMDLAKTSEKERPIVLVGTDAKDGRPFWMLRGLSMLGFEKVYWYNGSAEKLAQAVQH